MKTIGLIGGVSWVSTAEYYKRLNLLANKKYDGQTSAKIILSSLNFEDILPLQIAGNVEKEKTLLVEHAQRLEKAGADIILICSNTTNRTAHEVSCEINIPLLDIVDTVVAEVDTLKLRKVGLLGTKHVMYGSFYVEKLREKNIEPIVPKEQAGELIDNIIYQELVKNQFHSTSVNAIESIIENLTRQGAEAAILGCTELPLLILKKHNGPVLIDSIQTHVASVYDLI